MPSEILAAAALFAFVASITPGPNNIMLMSSGANFGIRRSLPHMLGVSLGFTAMLVLVGAGLMRLFDLWPPAYSILRVASVAYLLWLAWKVATAAGLSEGRSTGRPLTFLQAAAFQWVNPKAWATALSAITVYAPDRSLGAVLAIGGVFLVAGLPAIGSWTTLGTGMARILTSRRRLVIFNRVMAALLVASLWPVLRP